MIHDAHPYLITLCLIFRHIHRHTNIAMSSCPSSLLIKDLNVTLSMTDLYVTLSVTNIRAPQQALITTAS